jgi:hypothetical protein
MAEVLATYTIHKRGWWNTTHELQGPEGKLGTLLMQRNGWGMVVRGTYRPEKGEVLSFRRDPGILRSQFSLWTENREWLGSSLRSSFFRREIAFSTGNKPFRLLPLANFGRGWRMLAPKTGELARLLPNWTGSKTRLEVYRRVDPELLVFAYFIGSQVFKESWWPGRADDGDSESIPSPSKA